MNFIPGVALASFMFLLSLSASNAEELPAKHPENTAASQDGFNLWINPGAISYHFDRNAWYRELNWGIGVQSNLSDDMSVLAGNFINSDHARSHYAGLAWQPLSWRALKIGFVAGAFDGYPAMRNGGWFAAALPWVSIRNERIGVNLTVIPNYANRLHGAISAQVIFRVW